MLVEVFLNTNPRDSMFYGYRVEDTLVLAASYKVECPGEQPKDVDHTTLLEDAFHRFNVGDEEGDPIALEYRRNKHRSLSKGDVVVLNPRPDLRIGYAVMSTGWALTGKLKELRTPDQWAEFLGWTVVDPDGWRMDGKPWTDRITKGEFERRAGLSTATPPA